MDNSLIADAFEEMAELLELQGENPFRVRAIAAVQKRYASSMNRSLISWQIPNAI